MGLSHYTTSFEVRSYEVGRFDGVSAAAMLRYLEHLATQGSAAAGFPRAWYDAQETAWVVRQMNLEIERPCRVGEMLLCETWPSHYARIQAYREYVISSAASGEPLARAHAHWVYVSRQRGLPTRLPPAIVDQATPDPQEVVLSRFPALTPFPGEPIQFHQVLQARRYEADTMGHINNTVYVDWLEEAVYAALEQLPPDKLGSLGDVGAQGRCFLRRATIDYMKASQPGELLEIQTTLSGSYQDGLGWVQDIRRPDAQETVLRAESWWSWLG